MSNCEPYTMVGTPIEVAADVDPDITSMLRRFESLGVDCEFGLVQRRFGAEASGLLRWGTTPLRSLIRMFENEFRGIGELEFTSLQTASWRELFIVDHTYDLYNHTFIIDTGVDQAKLLGQQCARLRHLVAKLKESLSRPDRIFVYKSNDRLVPADAVTLHAALKRYGPHRLLCVAPAGSDLGTSPMMVQADLAMASIARPGPQTAPGGSYWNIDFAAWLRTCGHAGALLDPAWTAAHRIVEKDADRSETGDSVEEGLHRDVA